MLRDDEIFAEAMDLPIVERAAFLDRACESDTARRARIDALLTAYAEAEGFLELGSRPGRFSKERPGDVLGRYTLLRQIGEGGCGVVYLAEQHEPVRRRVALKVIKLGMDTQEVLRRFEAERQALALMDHPGIARVLDAGATEAGRPFFVMELVDGVAAVRFCDAERLSLAARLELFVRICRAVQHAHQKGVIHRDLKPSNILVARHDGVPVPKIIDFGIAKATSARLTDLTLRTSVDQMLGTPAYMSPEQANAAGDDLDTRSDIYALGVLLYELLAGRLPFDAPGAGLAGIDALRRVIREVDPPRPSLRFSALAAPERAALAEARGTAPAPVARALAGDLDWIVMRCLEKDRNRRYATAVELAEDIERHLRQEPVRARPPETLYRVKKFVVRHRFACANAAALVLALVTGTVVSVRQAVRATQAERDAQRRQEQVEDVLAFMVGDFREELKKAGVLGPLNALGEKALAYFGSLDVRDLTDTALTRQATALTQIGDVRMYQSRYQEAEQAYTAAYERMAALTARHPRDADMIFARAQAEFGLGNFFDKRGQTEAAAPWLIRYRDSGLDLANCEPGSVRARKEVLSGHHNLAVLELRRGRFSEARRAFLEELALAEPWAAAAPDDPDRRFKLADIHSYLGSIAERLGELEAAVRYFDRQAAELGALLARQPDHAKWRQFIVSCRLHQAPLLGALGRREEAANALAEAAPVVARLVAQDPANRLWALYEMNLRLERAALALAENQPADADIATALHYLQARPAAERARVGLVVWLVMAGRLEARRLAGTDALAAARAVAQAIEAGEPSVRDAGPDVAVRGELARTHVLAGQLAAGRHEPETARRHWQRAMELLKPSLADTRDWRLLDPAVRAAHFLGRTTESREFAVRLQAAGYRPLEPWPFPLSP